MPLVGSGLLRRISHSAGRVGWSGRYCGVSGWTDGVDRAEIGRGDGEGRGQKEEGEIISGKLRTATNN